MRKDHDKFIEIGSNGLDETDEKIFLDDRAYGFDDNATCGSVHGKRW